MFLVLGISFMIVACVYSILFHMGNQSAAVTTAVAASFATSIVLLIMDALL